MDTDAHGSESDVTVAVIGSAFEVANVLGAGFLEKYVADLVVEEKVIVELKCVERFAAEHLAQCINYLKASRLRVALLINFQKPKVEWKRVLRVSGSTESRRHGSRPQKRPCRWRSHDGRRR